MPADSARISRICLGRRPTTTPGSSSPSISTAVGPNKRMPIINPTPDKQVHGGVLTGSGSISRGSSRGHHPIGSKPVWVGHSQAVLLAHKQRLRCAIRCSVSLCASREGNLPWHEDQPPFLLHCWPPAAPAGTRRLMHIPCRRMHHRQLPHHRTQPQTRACRACSFELLTSPSDTASTSRPVERRWP